MKRFKKSDIIRFSLLAIFIIITVGLTIYYMPKLLTLTTPQGRVAFEEKLKSFGIWKYVAFVAIQILQVVFAFIPGEPIELAGGALFGWALGFLLCSLGALLGTVLVFYLVKWLGKPFMNVIIPEEKTKKFKFLNDEKRLKLTIFILYIIPGTPKDVLTYCAPLTPIGPLNFFLITLVARIPSIITSNIIGSSATQGNWIVTAVVTAITAALGIIGIWFSNKMSKNSNKSDDEAEND